jgi:hypothetical protein
LRIVTYAIRLPSGDHTGAMTNSVLALVVIRALMPVATSTMKRSAVSLGKSFLTTATRVPSGETTVSP